MPLHRIYKTGSPFNASELADVDYEQTADVLYLAHTNHDPQKLVRSGHSSWAFSSVAFAPLIAAPGGVSGVASNPNTDSANSGNAYFPQPATYCVTAVNEETGQESRASTTVTMTNDLSLKRNYNSVTWTAVAGATSYRVYKAENSQNFGHIGTTDQLNFRDDNIGPDLSQGPPIGDDPFSGAGNKPGTITFHEQRSIWGRTLNKPNMVAFSRSADYENMDYTRPTREEDAFQIGLVGSKVNAVNQMVSHKQGLLALTSHNIFSIQGSNEDYITATPPPRIRPEIGRGVSRLNPVSVDNVIFYETAKTGEVRTIGYEFEMDGIRTDDLTIFSRHLFQNKDIVAWAFAEKPASALYVVLNSGDCLCLTWDQAQQVWGWTRLETDGSFVDVCVVTEQGEDRAYFRVRRRIQGITRVYIERMASELWQGQENACYLDCARTFVNEVEVAALDRLDYLEGKTVVAWVDGAVVSTNPAGQPLIVTNGAIELSVPGLIITVGLPYTSTIRTLPLAMQTGDGWNIAKPQEVQKVVLRVINTRNVKVGPDEEQLFEIKQREWEDYPDPTALFTGDLEMDMPGTSGTETSVIIRSTDPTPMHVAAVLVEPRAGNMT